MERIIIEDADVTCENSCSQNILMTSLCCLIIEVNALVIRRSLSESAVCEQTSEDIYEGFICFTSETVMTSDKRIVVGQEI